MPDLTPGFDPKKVKKSVVRKIKAPVRRVRSEISRADRAVFGGGGLRSNIRKLKKELKNPSKPGRPY